MLQGIPKAQNATEVTGQNRNGKEVLQTALAIFWSREAGDDSRMYE